MSLQSVQPFHFLYNVDDAPVTYRSELYGLFLLTKRV